MLAAIPGTAGSRAPDPSGGETRCAIPGLLNAPSRPPGPHASIDESSSRRAHRWLLCRFWPPGKRPVIAQGAPETRAGEYYPGPNTGGFSAASTEPMVFQADFPFSAIAPHWSDAAGYGPQIQAKFSPDGSSWSDAVNLTASDHDAGRPDKAGRIFGNLVFPGQSQFVQYQTFDAAGEGAEVPDLGFTYIDATPGPTIDDVYAAATTPSLDPPPIISREAWGANESYRYDNEGLLWPLEYRTVEHVIIHHTETPNFQDPLVAIRSVYYYHAVTRGWGDIGYNYLVDFMGNVYEGRSGGGNAVGGHAYEYAYGSSGIGTMGRFRTRTPPRKCRLGWSGSPPGWDATSIHMAGPTSTRPTTWRRSVPTAT